MTAVSATVAERSRKAQSLALQRISATGQNTIADEIGLSAATVSRWVGEDLERACQVLSAAGLKLVPAEMQCFPPRKVAILMELARDHLNQLETVEQLQWE
ncbi:CII family transcriptional regulator [Paraburkholderia sp. J11-2]|uniref:CII family transcriptional regulator n=1 Tax=Paraburkholderia sp. J11-2 TaxID=2805431 RepID=UPI002AB6BE40|nr:CII family transcriptional regulator [Paraburkholderia sp. J11-2]